MQYKPVIVPSLDPNKMNNVLCV